MTITEKPIRGFYWKGRWFQLTEQIPSKDMNWFQATTNAFIHCNIGKCTYYASGSSSLEEHQLRDHTFEELLESWEK